jgi:hypothetical protein
MEEVKMGILEATKQTYDMAWNVNKAKKLSECTNERDRANMLEAIRRMEEVGEGKDKFMRATMGAAVDKWRRMTRKEQQQAKNEAKDYLKQKKKEGEDGLGANKA